MSDHHTNDDGTPGIDFPIIQLDLTEEDAEREFQSMIRRIEEIKRRWIVLSR